MNLLRKMPIIFQQSDTASQHLVVDPLVTAFDVLHMLMEKKVQKTLLTLTKSNTEDHTVLSQLTKEKRTSYLFVSQSHMSYIFLKDRSYVQLGLEQLECIQPSDYTEYYLHFTSLHFTSPSLN